MVRSGKTLSVSNKTQPLPSNPIFNSQFSQRKWLQKRGKSQHLFLSDDVMVKLRQYFKALDCHGYEYIGPQELEDPLIVFGMCQDKKQVEQLVKIIDTDFSGVIEFNEFVDIFKVAKNSKSIKSCKEKFSKFANIIAGNFSMQLENKVEIQTSISQYQRKMILDFIMKKNQQAMTDGRRIARHIARKSDKQDLLAIIKNYR